MKTKLLILVVLCALGVCVSAQNVKVDKPFKFGVGALAGLPLGDASDFVKMTWGVDLLGEYSVAPKVGLTINAGYNGWVGDGGTADLIPVLAGAKIYSGSKIYLSLQAGVTFSAEGGGGNAFTYAPGLGVKISDKLDLLLKYQAATQYGSTFSFIGLRLGIFF
jgi:hypothetical protein